MEEIAYLLLAIGLHGVGHVISARLRGMRMGRICRSATGLRLITESAAFPSYADEAWVALGGPLGNLLGNALLYLISLAASHPALWTICRGVLPISFFLGIWNLLPIEGFDGGRLLRCLMLRRNTTLRTADRVLAVSSALCFCFFWMLSMYLLLRTGRAFSLFWFCVQLFWGLYAQNHA